MTLTKPPVLGQHPGEVEQGRDGGLRPGDERLPDTAIDQVLADLDAASAEQ